MYHQLLGMKSQIEKEIALIEGRIKVSSGDYSHKRVKLQKTVATLAAKVQNKNDIWMEHMQEMTDIVDQLKGSYKEIVDPALQRWKNIQLSLVHARTVNEVSSHSHSESIRKTEAEATIEEALAEDIPKVKETKKEKESIQEIAKDNPFGKPKHKKNFNFSKQPPLENKNEELPEEIVEKNEPSPAPQEVPAVVNPSTEKKLDNTVPTLRPKPLKGKMHFDFPTVPKSEKVSEEKVEEPKALQAKTFEPVPITSVPKKDNTIKNLGNVEKIPDVEDIPEFEDIQEIKEVPTIQEIEKVKPKPEKKMFNLHSQKDSKPPVIAPEKKEEVKAVEESDPSDPFAFMDNYDPLAKYKGKAAPPVTSTVFEKKKEDDLAFVLSSGNPKTEAPITSTVLDEKTNDDLAFLLSTGNPKNDIPAKSTVNEEKKEDDLAFLLATGDPKSDPFTALIEPETKMESIQKPKNVEKKSALADLEELEFD